MEVGDKSMFADKTAGRFAVTNICSVKRLEQSYDATGRFAAAKLLQFLQLQTRKLVS